MKIVNIPQDDKTNGWSGMLHPRIANSPLDGDVHADWIVVGMGYAGLGAARQLAKNQPDQKIVLIDAGQAGENASGRNSGFAIDLPHNVGSSLEELDGSHRFMRLARAAISHLEEQIETHDIHCDWSKDGKYHAAVSPRGVREVLEPLAKELTALKEPFEWVKGQELKAKIGSEHFSAAIYTPGGALLNPAALCRGLADTLPDNVEIFEDSPVTEIDYANGVRITTPQGSVYAPKMILTTNGFSEQFGFYPRRFLHLATDASISRPLTPGEQASYGVEKPWGLTPANAFVSITMRYTNDHRILIRQGMNYCPSQSIQGRDMESIRANHQKLFDERFPQIAGVEMEHSWTGIICLSRNAAPGFGRLASNVWSAVCQNAVGVTKGTISGILAADLASGVDNPLIADMQSLGEPSLLPPQPLLGVGVRARLLWELWNNRHEA